MIVYIHSFGFKHEPPVESDLLFDVRFLPNPYYIPELQETTGLESVTASHVLDNDASSTFFNLLTPLLHFLMKQFSESKRDSITICIGCTGGRHRSVAVAEKLAEILAPHNKDVTVAHRDILKK